MFITDTTNPPKFKKASDLAIHQVPDVSPHGPWLVRTRQYSRRLLCAYPVYGLVEDDHDAFTVGILPDVVRGGHIATNFTSTADQALISFPFRVVHLPGLVGPCHWEACNLLSKIYTMSKAPKKAQAEQPTSKHITGPRPQLP